MNVKDLALGLLFTFAFSLSSYGQSTALPPTSEHGMFVEESGRLIKIIGQIAEFKRSGSLFVNDMTLGLKTRKENVQLLGATAQTAVSPQPVFYFVPAKQEQAVGVNAGDLILIRLEEKPNRRQFEIAASGAWRASSGISLRIRFSYFGSRSNPMSTGSCLPRNSAGANMPCSWLAAKAWLHTFMTSAFRGLAPRQ